MFASLIVSKADHLSIYRLNTNLKMGYEDSVYLAKLAEQAERYEGEFSPYSTTFGDWNTDNNHRDG